MKNDFDLINKRCYYYIMYSDSDISYGITDLEKVIDQVKDNNLSIYTNEYDLYMIKVFFPNIVCKLGYIPNSCAFVNVLTNKIADIHKISVSRTRMDSEIFSDITTEGSLFIHHLKGIPKIVEEEHEENKLIDCLFIDTLFPNQSKLKPLQITTVGKFSITSSMYNKKLCDIIRNETPKSIFDATSCVGGDTIGFAINLKCPVFGMERDLVNFNALQNNVQAFNLDKVILVHGDFVIDGYKFIEENKPEIVYFDPPWGGSDYIIQKSLELYLSNINIKDIISRILDSYSFVKNVILKVPANFNLKDIILKFNIVKMNKFNFIFFKRQDFIYSEMKVPSVSYLHSTLEKNYPLSIWVPSDKSKRSTSLPPELYNMTYKSIHWGQRKLHLSEVDFFTSNTNTTDTYTVVYAGAANGQHIPLLSKMFPNLEFHLYDPAPFSPLIDKENTKLKINLYKDSTLPIGFFTDEIALKYTTTKNLLFICDIRLAPTEKKNNPKYKSLFEEKVDNDMKIQKDWVLIMKPISSILKMRIPYNVKDKFEYLDGDVRFQTWAPIESTETRLVVLRKVNDESSELSDSKNNEFPVKNYVPETYERQCAYFNNQMRQFDIGLVTFKSVGIKIGDEIDGEVDSVFNDLWKDYGIFVNMDCYLETVLLCNYLNRIDEPVSLLSIKNLIDEISKWLYDIDPIKAFAKKIDLNVRKLNK